MAGLNQYQALNPASAAPAMEVAAVTPNDSADLPNGICRGLYIGGAGTLVLDTYSTTNVTFAGLVAGTVLPVQAKRVRTSTTATSIVALY